MRYLLVPLLTLALIHVTSRPAASEPPGPAPAGEKPTAIDDPTRKGDRLRRPGFVFLELDCHDLAASVDFFKAVAGYAVNRDDGNFVILRSERGEVLLNGVGGKPKDRPARYQGPRVEIGLVVDDLDRAFAEAKKRAGWKVAAGIQRQPWHARDFRVYSPEGYYLRVTEGPR